MASSWLRLLSRCFLLKDDVRFVMARGSKSLPAGFHADNLIYLEILLTVRICCLFRVQLTDYGIRSFLYL